MTSATRTEILSRPRRGRRRHHRVVRLSLAFLLVAVGVLGVVGQPTYRSFEATVAAVFLRPFVDGRVGSIDSLFWIVTDDFVQAFRVTAECTGIILISPLLGLCAILLAATRAPIHRLLAGLVVMYVVITVVNEFRLALIGFSSLTWGMDKGYLISHTFVGSIIGILGFALGLALLLIIGLGRGRRR